MPRKLLLAAITATFPAIAAACGPDTDCMIGDRSYRLQMPQGVAAPGAIIFAHGYKGSAAGTMRNRGLRALAEELDVALVAVKSYAEDWRIPGVPAAPGTDGQVEFDYFDALLDDLAAKGIDTDKLLVSGFSAGGMMVWQLACHRPDSFAGFAPISGTFWEPVPHDCDMDAVNLFHTHGMKDEIVPLEGRPIGSTRQASVPVALEMLRETGRYHRAGRFRAGGLDCRRDESPGGRVLEYCTHDGGHSLRTDYVRRAWIRLRELGAV